MNEQQIREHIEALLREEADGRSAAPHVAALVGQFLITQARIADALEKIAAKS